MNDNTKDNIGSFIAYNNIIRPINYPLFGTQLISGLLFLLYSLLFIAPPSKEFSLRVSLIGTFASLILFVLATIGRDYISKITDKTPDKCIYITQTIMYVYAASSSLLLLLFLLNFECEEKEIFPLIMITIFISIITVAAAYLIVRHNIQKGKYSNKKVVSDRTIAFSTSIGGSLLYIAVFQFVKNNFTGLGYALAALLMVQICLVLALIYYLKLRYAKKYGLEEYLPERPHPSKYTGWL